MAKPAALDCGPERPKMNDAALVTDDDLARARLDPAFRRRLVADGLDLLLSELNKLRACTAADAKSAAKSARTSISPSSSPNCSSGSRRSRPSRPIGRPRPP